jgi:hypothetical protein
MFALPSVKDNGGIDQVPPHTAWVQGKEQDVLPRAAMCITVPDPAS